MAAERNPGRLDHVAHNHDSYDDLAALGVGGTPDGGTELDAIDYLHCCLARSLSDLGQHVLSAEQQDALFTIAGYSRAGVREWLMLLGFRHSVADLLVKQGGAKEVAAATDLAHLFVRGAQLFRQDRNREGMQ